MTREQVLEKNKRVLSQYLPDKAIDKICEHIFEYDFKLIIKGDRKSKWGDIRYPHGNITYPIITINKSLNKYAFLITLVHEIAHCKTYREHGYKAEAHGKEWKRNFQILMQSFLNTDVFPPDVLYILRQHIQNPTASAHADTHLYKVLMNYDNHTTQELTAILEWLKDGDKFEYEGKIYQKLSVLRKRILCLQLDTHKKYVFSPIAEVKPIESNLNL